MNRQREQVKREQRIRGCVRRIADFERNGAGGYAIREAYGALEEAKECLVRLPGQTKQTANDVEDKEWQMVTARQEQKKLEV